MATDPRFVGLPDAEVERLAKLPLVTKAQMFAPAEQWLERNRAEFTRMYQGRHLMVSNDLTVAVGVHFADAATKYRRKHGPAPATGRHTLCVIL